MSNKHQNQRGEGHPAPTTAPTQVSTDAVYDGAEAPPGHTAPAPSVQGDAPPIQTPPNRTSPDKPASPNIDPNIVYPGPAGEAIVPGVPHNPPSALPNDPHARTGGETNAPGSPDTEKQSSHLLNSPKVVRTLGRQPAHGGRRVIATSHINRLGGYLSPGDEFELRDDEELRLKGAYKEI